MTEPAHKAKTKEFRDNYDRIFKKGLLGDEVMQKNGVRRIVALYHVRRFEKHGWERAE